MSANPLRFKKNYLELLDQRLLPDKEVWLKCYDSKKVYWAIQEMVVRGAPAIGVVGGYGLYLGISKFKGTSRSFMAELKRQAKYLKASRPTGVNLRNVIDMIVKRIENETSTDVAYLKKRVFQEAKQAHLDDDHLCHEIGRHGAKLFRKGDSVLTHCNAGGLATTGYGTALGVLYACQEQNKKITVYADETRPLLQGARLTAWELTKNGVPCTVLCDNMAASMMGAKKIDRIVVGADRIAANGDTANKIGTYNLAVLANYHHIPFYIAAPSTTFDFKIRTGKDIPIENRAEYEVRSGLGKNITPKKAKIANPAFDVTPHSLITAFITELGVLRPSYQKSFTKVRKKSLSYS